jgi:hypothetical protein
MFGFGMVIRNKYIYDAHVRCEADHVSSMIVARLASMIISSRLRDDIQIVLLDVREGKASVKYYSDRLRDSEEVARALIKAGRQSKLSEMSERIQKKYRRKQK